MHVFTSKGILDETRDLTKGAEQCVLLAELVHRQCSEDKELSARIRETGNFGWTPQPEVELFASFCVETVAILVHSPVATMLPHVLQY